MGFIVTSDLADEPIYEGMKIDYLVSPLLKIPMKWKTIIKQVEQNKSFTDFQQKGPYKYWNHFHEFIPNEKGVLMKDTIDYELPLGFLGSIAHVTVVKSKLNHIFNYRYDILKQFFNQQK